jgi:hypothetical protein
MVGFADGPMSEDYAGGVHFASRAPIAEAIKNATAAQTSKDYSQPGTGRGYRTEIGLGVPKPALELSVEELRRKWAVEQAVALAAPGTGWKRIIMTAEALLDYVEGKA